MIVFVLDTVNGKNIQNNFLKYSIFTVLERGNSMKIIKDCKKDRILHHLISQSVMGLSLAVSLSLSMYKFTFDFMHIKTDILSKSPHLKLRYISF